MAFAGTIVTGIFGLGTRQRVVTRRRVATSMKLAGALHERAVAHGTTLRYVGVALSFSLMTLMEVEELLGPAVATLSRCEEMGPSLSGSPCSVTLSSQGS